MRFAINREDAQRETDEQGAVFDRLLSLLLNYTAMNRQAIDEEHLALAQSATYAIYKAVGAYHNATHGLMVREGQVRELSARKTRKGVDDLKRLARPKKSEDAWQKAWLEKSPQASKALQLAAKRAGVPEVRLLLRGSMSALEVIPPRRSEIEPLIYSAIEIARAFTTTKPERDHAVEEVFRAQRRLLGRKPTMKNAIHFLEQVRVCFGELIPNDFVRGIRKNATFNDHLRRLFMRSLAD
jgi:hypothetical protein